MPIYVNPEEIRINIPFGKETAVLILKDYTTSEFEKFMNARYSVKSRGRISDRSNEARIKFIDDILIGIAAKDAEGRRDVVMYRNPATGLVEDLTPQVDNWKQYVKSSWKISAALELEGENAEVEQETIKN